VVDVEDRLTVRFVDQEVVLEPGEDLVFGRGAELDIDSNPYLHRRVGRFVHADGVWWLENLSTWGHLAVLAHNATSSIGAEGRAALVAPETVVHFEAGACRYELTAVLGEPVPLPQAAHRVADPNATVRVAPVPLTDEQRLMVVLMAEPRLRDPLTRTPLPTNRSIADRLGWSLTKLNRKLDYLCQKLTAANVPGLARSRDDRANDRRERLVEHLISTGQVTTADLDSLDDA
jgi:hypothetical protein